jgi:FkbM family methyltransferase
MIISTLAQLARFRHHLGYHRQILKHIRWTAADEARLGFYGTMIGPGDLVFDIGANMGNRSKIFRKLGARVIAFEPQTYCAEFLAAAFAGDDGFILERTALSETEGEKLMHLGDAHTLATLDTEWIDRMADGGRFASHRWNETETVHTTTLDYAIGKYGMPAFMKIDVEGHEYSVLKGLSQPVRQLSLEFASESLDSIYRCIDHLEALAPCEYRLSLGESMQFEEEGWYDGTSIKTRLAAAATRDPLVWGDVYARCGTTSGNSPV